MRVLVGDDGLDVGRQQLDVLILDQRRVVGQGLALQAQRFRLALGLDDLALLFQFLPFQHVLHPLGLLLGDLLVLDGLLEIRGELDVAQQHFVAG